MILFFAFIGILLITFCTIALVTRPTAEQKAVNRRIAVIGTSGVEANLGGSGLELLKATNSSDFAWLERLLDSFHFSQQLQRVIAQANSTTTIGKLAFMSGGTAFGGFFICYFFLPSIPISLLAALGFSYIPFGMLLLRRKRRIAAFNTALPDAIDMMARALRAGHSMVASINIVAEQAIEPAKFEFGEVFKKQNYGLPLRDALMQMLERVPSQDLRVLITAILVQKDTGGNLVDILERTVFVIRERLRIQGEIRVHTAQGRMTGWILCLLPIVMMFLINIINPGYSNVLLHDPFGRKLLYTGVVLLCMGGFIIRQIVNGIEI